VLPEVVPVEVDPDEADDEPDELALALELEPEPPEDPPRPPPPLLPSRAMALPARPMAVTARVARTYFLNVDMVLLLKVNEASFEAFRVNISHTQKNNKWENFRRQ
jgi:hypothetical protein